MKLRDLMGYSETKNARLIAKNQHPIFISYVLCIVEGNVFKHESSALNPEIGRPLPTLSTLKRWLYCIGPYYEWCRHRISLERRRHNIDIDNNCYQPLFIYLVRSWALWILDDKCIWIRLQTLYMNHHCYKDCCRMGLGVLSKYSNNIGH